MVRAESIGSRAADVGFKGSNFGYRRLRFRLPLVL